MPVIATAITAVTTWAATAFAAVSAFVTSTSIGSLLLRVGLNLAGYLLFAPKKASVAQRQGSVLEVQLGEVAREAVLGLAATGGSMSNPWNDGPDNDWETVVYQVADHEITAYTGYILQDKVYELTNDGEQDHEDFKDDNGNIELEIYFRKGAPGETPPAPIMTQGVAADQYSDNPAKFVGLAYVVVRYHVSPQAWKSGRPTGFRWLVRGAKVYDPRLDDTVDGGAGPHRWGEPDTYEWSENAAVLHYNFIRGIWNYAADPPQLMVGPGRSAQEAPPENAIYAANVCDEDVALKAGGTEKRYTASCVIPANEPWINTEEHFAAAMGGQLVERSGTIAIDVGAAKTVELAFSDGDMIVGADVVYQAYVGRESLINTVVARYVDRAQLYEQASAPMRRSLDDIAADGEVREQSLDLVFVTSQTQAQRIAEIIRRKARLQATGVVPLGPKYLRAEDADWASWSSDRRFAGETYTFELQGVSKDENCNVTVAVKRIAASVFTWNPAIDELDPVAPAYLPSGNMTDAQLLGFAVEATTISNETGSQTPAIRATFTPPTDVSIKAILIEWRKQDTPDVVSTRTTENVSAGEIIISDGLVGGATFEVRLTPIPTPTRPAVATDWEEVDLDDFASGYTLGFTPIKTANMRIVNRSFRKLYAADVWSWDDDDPLEWDDDDPIEISNGWDGEVYSAESYTGGASALAIAIYTDKAVAFGLAQTPAVTTHFFDIDFCWLLGADGKRRIYELGVLVWDNGGSPEDYEANDVFSVVYDGAFVRYYVSGVLKHESLAAPALQLFFDSSFYADASRLDGIAFTSSATSGEIVETRYQRSVSPPATPTGADPVDWTTAAPVGDAALWSTSATKTLSGAIVDVWSTPALLTSPNWRGVYDPATTYYREDAVTLSGGSYRCIVESTTGNAPSGTQQDNAYFVCLAAPGQPGTPATPPSGFSATIDLPSSASGVNLYDLAVANGYTSLSNATITFEAESGCVITGVAGALNGGIAIDSGTWPTDYALALTLRLKSGSIIRGGGGKGGKGGNSSQGENGGNGGDAIRLLVDFSGGITIDSGATAQGGGGGGGGGRARRDGTGPFGIPLYDGGGGGGGGKPNGPGGDGGNATDDGDPGTAATTSAVGTGGASDHGEDGVDGADYGATAALPSNDVGQPGVGGYCIRKNGKTATVTNNGTTAGTIG